MVVQCCVCKRVRVDGAWAPPVQPIDPDEVSHAYCPACHLACTVEIFSVLAGGATAADAETVGALVVSAVDKPRHRTAVRRGIKRPARRSRAAR